MKIFKKLNDTCIKVFSDKDVSIVLKHESGDFDLKVIIDKNSVKYSEETETSIRTTDPVLSIDKSSLSAGVIISEGSIIEIDDVEHSVREVIEDSEGMIKLDMVRV